MKTWTNVPRWFSSAANRWVRRTAELTAVCAALIGAESLQAQAPRHVSTHARQPQLAVPLEGEITEVPPATVVGPDYMIDDDGRFITWPPALPADCGLGCAPGWLVRTEGLLMNREGERGTTASSNFQLSDFGYEDGYRLTVDRKYDCAIGWELVYTGFFEWIEGGTATGAGTLTTTLSGSGIDLSAFNGADSHTQSYRSRLQSVEAVQKWWGWDVIATSFGTRYINVDESFGFRSVDSTGDIGTYNVNTDNHLLGLQLGLDMLFPIGNWSFDTMLKGGLFVNFADSDVRLVNAGVAQINNSAEDIEFAAMIEYGTYIRRVITPRITARAGYEFLWIYGVAVAAEQARVPLSPTSGRSVDGQGDIFYHGASAGVEITF